MSVSPGLWVYVHYIGHSKVPSNKCLNVSTFIDPLVCFFANVRICLCVSLCALYVIVALCVVSHCMNPPVL